jgi:hypothetical protein
MSLQYRRRAVAEVSDNPPKPQCCREAPGLIPAMLQRGQIPEAFNKLCRSLTTFKLPQCIYPGPFDLADALHKSSMIPQQ